MSTSRKAGPAIPSSLTERNSNIDFRPFMKTSSSLPSPTDRVIESFQQTMQAFLEVQKSTMLAYLAGRAAASSSAPPVVRIETEDRSAESPSTALASAAPAPSRNVNGRSPRIDRSGSREDHDNGSVVEELHDRHATNANGN